MRTAVVLLSVLTAVLAGAAQSRPADVPGAASDVRLLASQLESIHPDLFRHVTQRLFRAETDQLARRAPSLTSNELLVGLMRIAALPGPRNGHTGIFPLHPHRRQLHLYPLRLYDFADGIYVVDAGGPELVGTRLVAMAGTPIGRVLRLVGPLVPRDNASSLRGAAPHYALVAEVLDGLGIADGIGPLTFTFERENGERFETVLTPLTVAEYAAEFADPLHGHYPAALPHRSRPLYLAESGRELFVRKLAGGRVLYVGYNTALVPTSGVAQRIQRLARSPRVERVVVDVRLNGGGNNLTTNPLLAALASKQVNRRGRLFLLIGRATFSAAGNFAADVDRFTRATLVGEPTGGGVNQYGDPTTVTLPATGWEVRIATSYVVRGEPGDRRLAVEPDVRVDLRAADFFEGRDPVLAVALRGL
jgi:hypothetical protein